MRPSTRVAATDVPLPARAPGWSRATRDDASPARTLDRFRKLQTYCHTLAQTAVVTALLAAPGGHGLHGPDHGRDARDTLSR